MSKKERLGLCGDAEASKAKFILQMKTVQEEIVCQCRREISKETCDEEKKILGSKREYM